MKTFKEFLTEIAMKTKDRAEKVRSFSREREVVRAHKQELKKRNIKANNFGWAQDEHGIASKTDHGTLSTVREPIDSKHIYQDWNKNSGIPSGTHRRKRSWKK